jgi:hypothetical protein
VGELINPSPVVRARRETSAASREPGVLGASGAHRSGWQVTPAKLCNPLPTMWLPQPHVLAWP